MRRRQQGQSTVLTAVLLAFLLGMTALVLDVGSWFRADRALQATADAAALAGAQGISEGSIGRATDLAVEYAEKNDESITVEDIRFSDSFELNDTITVEIERSAPGFFSRLFGLGSVKVSARATARSARPSAARWVAPVVVNEKHPLLACDPQPCFNEATELELIDLHRPGSGDAAAAFGLINLDRDDQGSVGDSTLSEWMHQGFDGYMPIGMYTSVPSAKFNSSQFQEALDIRRDDDVLFPIYRSVRYGGSNAEYDIIGWVGFHINGFNVHGSNGKVFGYFTRVIWEGIQAESGDDDDFGVRTVELVE